MRGIHRWPVNSPHKEPMTWKMFPFDDVIMRQPSMLGLASNLTLNVVTFVNPIPNYSHLHRPRIIIYLDNSRHHIGSGRMLRFHRYYWRVMRCSGLVPGRCPVARNTRWHSTVQGWANFLRSVIFLIFQHRQNPLALEYHVNTWQVSPQLSCDDTCQNTNAIQRIW